MENIVDIVYLVTLFILSIFVYKNRSVEEKIDSHIHNCTMCKKKLDNIRKIDLLVECVRNKTLNKYKDRELPISEINKISSSIRVLQTKRSPHCRSRASHGQ